ncbi:hypothetical protein [Pendulispora albinea]|uniref:DUF1579 domain-containing protein n=1 Tax=Pendulispora albinea TaxID=2741071 RepID=A0ABZ2LK30_9BACT
MMSPTSPPAPRRESSHDHRRRTHRTRRAIGILPACIYLSACAAGAPLQAQTTGAAAAAKPAPAAKPATSAPSPSSSAIERMLALGPEGEELTRRSGTWTVVSTIRVTPNAPPMVTAGLIAERTMVGLYQQEIMRPAPGSNTPDFRRIAYITFNRVEGRYQYVSMDTRFPVGIMPAWSFGAQRGPDLTFQFEPLAFVGLGREVEGRMFRSNFVITRDSEDHEFGRQYWIQSDGTAQEWLAVQYEYTRKR